MASLVSPGVSVTITNESFFIPAQATTVPLFFVTSADQKFQADGATPAAGTYESNTIRTVTSLTQSTQLYGIPKFLTDSNGNPHHGDCRNEYGLFALNQYLGIGTLAYAVRANVNLNDNLADIQTMWNSSMQQASYVLENTAASYINQYNVSNGLNPANSGDIVSFGAVVGGSGYTNGTYTNVPLIDVLPPNGGSGATANITVAGGAVTLVLLNQAGTEYTVADTLSANPNIIGNGIATLGAISGGSLYTPGTYTNVPLIGGTGTGALATIIVGVSNDVTSVAITAAGVGYTIGDTLTATPLTGVFSTTGFGTGFAVPVATIAASSGFTVAVGVTTANTYKTTLNNTELYSLAQTATAPVFALFSFNNSQSDFYIDHSSSPLSVYPNGLSNPPVPPAFLGFIGQQAAWMSGLQGSVPPHTGWTPSEAASFLLSLAGQFQNTADFASQTSLGANDAARRSAIITALAAVVNSNTDIRSETYEYNLILCPGFPELAQEMVNLSIDIQEEALIIGDTPFTSTPDTVVSWAATVARESSSDIAYYYPHGLATNLDGNTVFVAASGTALATITYSDNVSQVWFAPAGLRRGLVTSLTDVGYVTGTLGTATTFVEAALNQGQRDNLYKYFTNINPIVFFPGQGIVVWGQKTSPPAASALDRVNVVRLMMYIKRALRKNSMVFVFEPNDALTRANLKAVVDGFLSNLITLRGLYDFATVCDTSNNTPDRIDANELYIDIALKPVRAAEFIYIPIRVVATSASLTTNG